MSELDPEDFAAEVRDSLVCADLWVGGAIGVLPLGHEGEIRAYMTGRGWLGPAGYLTRKGVREAWRLQREEFGE